MPPSPPTPNPAPEADSITCVLPEPVLQLGQALAPVASQLRGGLRRRPAQTGDEFEVPGDVTLHLVFVMQHLGHLGKTIDQLSTEVLNAPEASALDVGRAAGRLEQVLIEFTQSCHEAMRSRETVETAQARTLTIGVYRHYLRQVADWLDRLVAAIEDPLKALREQGIAPAEGVTLPIALGVTTPSQYAELVELANALREHADTTGEHPEERSARAVTRPAGPGLLGTLGAMVLGFGIAGALSGGGENDRE
jgi:hypothetical protein